MLVDLPIHIAVILSICSRFQIFLSNLDEYLKTKDQLDVTGYFYFTFYALNMFWTLIYPSSGAYGYSVE